MNILKLLRVLVLASIVITLTIELGEYFSVPWVEPVVPSVEARVGRPLTPVSVAGVARRTVRRCAVGVYHCNIHDTQGSGSLAGQIGSLSNSKGQVAWQGPIVALR